MLDVFKNVSIDRRDELVLAVVAVVIPLVAVLAMTGL